ncbi:DUF3108 domain-containing protein [Spiribacter vilamensis]|uniref:Uncharacterized protein DUF3108 n=1 Tax=Spiribacter vilamensis TaxID=531306 RepID=A0A4Q8D125_9GAMM|nr:DUF3108 domain-containing protein [Spiribacter vilamensis]RZU98994.1 uncharacterized protein DUF3108 [Spiribacter vilamensis]TVO62002.1 DUF3108 domain-containing protein [Spiribacter vilamensis]
MTWRRRLGIGLVAVMMVVGTGPLAGAASGAEPAVEAPPAFSARYDVRKAGLTLGHAELRFRRPTESRYLYRLSIRPGRLAGMFYSSTVREMSIGRIQPDGFRPDVYRYNRSGGDDDRRAELRFDWDTLSVVNDIEARPWRMDITPDTIDRVISPLQLMHDLADLDGDDELVYRIADGGQLKTYVLRVGDKTMVETPAGRFEALRIRRSDTDSDRETTLWVAPALRYLAVQVEQREDGDRNFRMVLNTVDGLPADAR